jgi:hypothetical protein
LLRSLSTLFAITTLAACQQPSATAAPPSPQNQITGAASCPSAESQDITFSGSVIGQVMCSTSPATCLPGFGLPNDRERAGVAMPLNAKVGSTAVQLNIAYRKATLGALTAGPLGDNEAFSGDQGVTFEGIGHWSTPVNGGTMTLSTFDAASASGSVDVKLTSGSRSIAVKGSWRCVKPAGF